MNSDLAARLRALETQAREGLSAVSYSEIVKCRHCPEHEWVRKGVHKVAQALWDLDGIIRELTGDPRPERMSI